MIYCYEALGVVKLAPLPLKIDSSALPGTHNEGRRRSRVLGYISLVQLLW